MYDVILCGTNRLFIEVPIFIKQVEIHGGDELLRTIQTTLLENISIGKTIAGTGGIKKLRLPDLNRGKGKRGGLRVLYLDLSDQEITYLIYLYNKDESEDISTDEKKAFRNMVTILKGGRK